MAAASSASSTVSTASSASLMDTGGSTRTALIIDGSYAIIGARSLGGKIDYIKLRAALEKQAAAQFGDCWFFDQNPSAQRLNLALTAEYHMLKFAPPDGPQFQVSLFPMKKYSCHCKKCGNRFTQNVQKGVDNGIATKILSLAYENICERFILFAGDGDFYSSLSHVRNVLRKDIWVVGYRGTVSGDLQQLASRVIWMNDLWSEVKTIREVRPREQGRRDEGRRDTPGWFEDHEGEDLQLNNGSSSQVDESKDVGSDRQVIIAPLDVEATNHPSRGRSRGRTGRQNGKGKARNGRGRSRSRSRERPRAEHHGDERIAAPMAVPENGAMAEAIPTVAEKTAKKSSAEGKRGAGGKNGKKRKRNENNERGRGKRQADDAPVFTLSDVSSDEGTSKPFPLSLPVPMRSAEATPVLTAQGRNGVDGVVDEFGRRAQVIDLASDTESE